MSGLILAGGRSRRFGSDKARHVYLGRPLAEHVYEALHAVSSPVRVSAGTGGLSGFGFAAEVVPDAFPDAGPLAGLEAGLRTAPTPWVLVCPCDMPFMTAEALRLLSEARVDRVSAVIAVDEEGRVHPLCGCYHTEVHGVIVRCLERGRLAVREMVAVLPRVVMVPLPGAVLRNINQRRDLQSAMP